MGREPDLGKILAAVQAKSAAEARKGLPTGPDAQGAAPLAADIAAQDAGAVDEKGKRPLRKRANVGSKAVKKVGSPVALIVDPVVPAVISGVPLTELVNSDSIGLDTRNLDFNLDSNQLSVAERAIREGAIQSASTPGEFCAAIEALGVNIDSRTSGEWAGTLNAGFVSFTADESQIENFAQNLPNAYGIDTKWKTLALAELKAKQDPKTPGDASIVAEREAKIKAMQSAQGFIEFGAALEELGGQIEGKSATDWAAICGQGFRKFSHKEEDIDAFAQQLPETDGIRGTWRALALKRLKDKQIAATPDASEPNKEAYAAGDVFAQQILEEADRQRDEKTDTRAGETMHAADSVKGKEILAAHGVESSPEAMELTRIEKAIKALYNTMTDENGKVVEAGTLVDARKAYADAEYRNVGVWQRLREKLGVRRKESDSVAERTKYNEALQQLVTLKVDRLRALVAIDKKKEAPELSPEYLKEAMVEELQFIGTESKIKLYEAWTQATMERAGRFAKGWRLCEDFGNGYNKLKLWQKLGIGAAALGFSVATGGGAAATGMLIARRGAAGLGTFVTLEGFLEKISQSRASNAVKNKAEQSVSEMKEGDAEQQLKQLLKKLKGEVSKDNLRQELHDRAKGKTVRTLTAAALSLGAMFGIPAVADHVKDTYFAAAEVAEAVNEVPHTTGVALGTPLGEHVAVAGQGPAVAAEAQPQTPVPSAAEAHTGGNVYEVSRGDNVDGLIESYLDEHYPKFDGMTAGQKTHAINALERHIRLLSPEQLRAAGIGSGNIHKLVPGQFVDIDKLFNLEDADKAMGKAADISAAAQHSIEQNNEVIAKFAAEHPNVPINEVSIENQILHPHTAPASHVMNGRGTIQLPPPVGAGTPPDYVPADDSTVEPLKEEVAKLKQEVSAVRELAGATAMQPRVDGWIGPILRAVPEGGSLQPSVTIAEFKKIPLRDIQYAMTHDSADAYEKVHMTRDQFANVKQFIQGVEKDRLVPPLNGIADRRPDLKIGDYLTKIALDPKVKIGYMVGGRGGFSTSV